jgi:hypothetical protein
MSRADWISGVFWLLFAVFISIESKRLGLGTLRGPGPGFLSFWASNALGLMSVVILIRAWTEKKAEQPGIPIFGRQHSLKVPLVLISVFLYAMLMETFGFIPLTLMLFLFLLGVVEKKRWPFTVFVSIVVTAGSYLIFEVWLRSQLPKGLLGLLRF